VDFYEEKGDRYHFPKAFPQRLKTRIAMFFADDDFSTNFYFLERTMRKPGTVLDVGCGGGNMFYLSVGPTVGIDLAFASLKRASAVYPQVARAKVEALPLPNNAFDYVVSTDVLEHLSPTVKDKALSEMTRVLKPGGLMIHICPVDSHHFLMRWAKRFPELYSDILLTWTGTRGLKLPMHCWSGSDSKNSVWFVYPSGRDSFGLNGR